MLAQNVKTLGSLSQHETIPGHQIWLVGYQLRKKGCMEGVGARRREETYNSKEA